MDITYNENPEARGDRVGAGVNPDWMLCCGMWCCGMWCCGIWRRRGSGLKVSGCEDRYPTQAKGRLEWGTRVKNERPTSQIRDVGHPDFRYGPPAGI